MMMLKCSLIPLKETPVLRSWAHLDLATSTESMFVQKASQHLIHLIGPLGHNIVPSAIMDHCLQIL